MRRRREAWRRLPGLVLRNTSLCAASGAALLRSCEAGFAPSAELRIAGADLDPAHANLLVDTEAGWELHEQNLAPSADE